MTGDDRLRIEVRRSGDVIVLAPRGEFDLASSPAFGRAVQEARASHPGSILVDLSELEFIDSTGLRTVLDAHKQCVEDEIEFAVTSGAAQVARLMQITRIADHVRIVASADELVGEG